MEHILGKENTRTKHLLNNRKLAKRCEVSKRGIKIIFETERYNKISRKNVAIPIVYFIPRETAESLGYDL